MRCMVLLVHLGANGGGTRGGKEEDRRRRLGRAIRKGKMWEEEISSFCFLAARARVLSQLGRLSQGGAYTIGSRKISHACKIVSLCSI